MKTLITTFSLLAGLTIGAQNAELQIHITMDQALTGASWTNSMTLDLSPYGSHFNDVLDTTAPITNCAIAYPFTVNSSYSSLRVRDSRPNLYMTRNFAFGVWNVNSGELHIKAEWADANDALLYDVTFVDNGIDYNMYNENTFNIANDTNFASRFTLRVSPKMHAQGFSETCFGTNDGSIYAKSPSPYWSVEMYHNSVYVNTFSITGVDTLFAGLAQGSYDLVYLLMDQPVDTVAISVSGPAAVISGATVSNSSPVQNEVVNFTNTSTGATIYAWDFGDGGSSTVCSPTYSYPNIGTYTVTLVATNTNGCSSTSTFQVDVQVAPMAMPPLGGRGQENEDPTANTERTSTTQVQSNNNTAALSIKGDATISQFSVFSMNGQLQFGGNGSDKTFTYDAPGIYLIQITYTDGTTESKQWYLN